MDATEIAYAGVAGQAELLRDGTVTATDLVDVHLERIARHDTTLGSFRVVLADQARAEAAAAQRLRDAGDQRPLLGVPIAIKDNVDLAGQQTFNGVGSAHPAAADDADVVRLIRAAGLVVVGKTNCPELGLWAFTETPTHGVTRNPWDLTRTPGGSSGGAAAAVAAGLVPAAHGNDGGGSIRIPAACCGLVGLKPTRDLLPTDPDHWPQLNHEGFLTRTARDQAVLLGAMVDAALSAAADADPPPLRIGWTRRPPAPARLTPMVRAAFDRTLGLLRGFGHDVLPTKLPYGEAQHVFLPRFMRAAADDVQRLADPTKVEPRTAAMARLGRRVPEPVLRRAFRDGDRMRERFVAGMAALDVVVLPMLTRGAIPVRRYAKAGPWRTMFGLAQWMPYAPAFNITGQPAMSIPAGVDADGLPLAVQLVGKPGAEATLLALAGQLERAAGWPDRRPALPE